MADTDFGQLKERHYNLRDKVLEIADQQQRLVELSQVLANKVRDAAEVRDRMARNLRANTDATERIDTNTADLIAAFQAIKGGLAVLEWVGKWGSKLAWVVGLITLAWSYLGDAWHWVLKSLGVGQ